MSNPNVILEKLYPKEGFIQYILNKSLLGGSDALEFQNELNEVLKSEEPNIIIFDLAKTEQINSSGLGMLVASNSIVQRNGKSLILINLPTKVKELVRMTHLDKVLKISDNLESALS